MEQAEMRRTHRMNMPATVRLPPAWGEVHAKAAQQQSLHGARAGPPPKVGFPRSEDGLLQPSGMTASCTSSVADAPPGSPSAVGHGAYGVGGRSALGGSSKSGLNHTSTYFYGEAPLKPVLCTGNMYNAVGSYSMFGSQVHPRSLQCTRLHVVRSQQRLAARRACAAHSIAACTILAQHKRDAAAKKDACISPTPRRSLNTHTHTHTRHAQALSFP